MCQKQCRDENGFKCHLSSEGHKRQMEIFGQNPERIVDGWVGGCGVEWLCDGCAEGVWPRSAALGAGVASGPAQAQGRAAVIGGATRGCASR